MSEVKPRPYQRYCLRGHDTWLMGRYESNNCKECTRENSFERERTKGRERQLGELGETAVRRKAQPSGGDLHKAIDADPKSDEWIAAANLRYYRKQGKRVCEFAGCGTRIRYRSKYAPYCERHSTEAKRGEAWA